MILTQLVQQIGKLNLVVVVVVVVVVSSSNLFMDYCHSDLILLLICHKGHLACKNTAAAVLKVILDTFEDYQLFQVNLENSHLKTSMFMCVSWHMKVNHLTLYT